MKIEMWFHVGGGREGARYYLALGESLAQRGIIPKFFCYDKEASEVFEKAGKYEFLDCARLATKGDSSLDPRTAHKVIEAVRKTRRCLRSIYFTQSIVDETELQEKEWSRKSISYLFPLLNYHEKPPNAKYYFDFAGDDFYSNLFKMFCLSHGGKLIYYQATPFIEREGLTEDMMGIWLINDTIPKKQSREMAKRYLDSLLKERKVIGLRSVSEYDIQYKAVEKKFIKHAFGYLRSENRKDVHKNIFAISHRFAKRNIRKALARWYYQKPVWEELFFYFPLHVPKDSQVTYRCRHFHSQDYVVEMIARCLPHGYKLWVKEHPLGRGYYPYKMIRKIGKLQNVRLLHPWVNSHDIIDHADVTIVLNSTVGFEAICHRKPVVTLARSFYRGHGLTIDVDNLYELESALIKALDFKVDQQKIVDFIANMYEQSFPPGVKVLFQLNKEVLPQFADILFTKIKNLEVHKKIDDA